MAEEDYVFTPELLDKYTAARIFSEADGITPAGVSCIVQHNGRRLGLVLRRTKDGLTYTPPETKESYVFEPSERTIHIPNPIGNIRRERTRRTVTSWLERCVSQFDKYRNVSIEYREEHYRGAERRGSQQYDVYAYDLIKGLFTKPKELLKGSELNLASALDIDAIIMGDLDSVTKAFSCSQNFAQLRILDDYLNHQFIQAAGKTIWCLDYIFGDQAETLVRKIARDYDSLSRVAGTRICIPLFHFGKFGGLLPSMKRGDIAVPTAGIEEHDYASSDFVEPVSTRNGYMGFDAQLQKSASEDGRGIFFATTLNALNVVDQKKSILERARKDGAGMLDMESLSLYDAVRVANRRYASYENGGVNFLLYMMGYISDNPLKGDTLAEPFEDSAAKDFCAQQAKKMICGQF